jgi:alpha-D-ribose 1-methylphosphonate 5-triphosphate synthase subunit PhnG
MDDCQDTGCQAERDRAALLAAIDALLSVADRHERIAGLLTDLTDATNTTARNQAVNAATRHRRTAATIRHKIDHAVSKENHV